MLHMKKVFILLILLLEIFATSKAQIVINEYSAANLNTVADNFGKFEDWVELYNAGNSSVDISGYYVSDNPAEPKKWQFPQSTLLNAKSHLVLWCNGRDSVLKVGSVKHFHTNFKLTQTKKKAETIVLSDASGQKIDEVKVQKTRAEQSRGRITSGDSAWVVFRKATPKSSNGGLYFNANAEKPLFSVSAGFYTANQKITISTKEPNAKIYFTINGSEPTAKNGTLYADSVVVTKTTVLKAVTIPNDTFIQPSLTEFSTYFINNKHSLKVVSIGGGTPIEALANGNGVLVPYGSFELFDETGERKATTFGELNKHGQDSWRNKQRSLDFVSRDECGYDSAIKDKMFKLTERDEFQRIILRAAGDDNYPDGSGTKGGGAHLRDAYLQNLVKKGNMHLDTRTGEKAIVYINGKYWGVYDLRERPEDHDYTEFNYGQGKYDLQYIQTWANTWAEYGDNKALTDWTTFSNYARKADLKDSAAYHYVTEQLDVKSLTDYIITNSVSVCSDWINYNTGWWRGMNPQGTHRKWGYQLWDNDATFGYYVNYTAIPDTAATKAKPCDVDLLGDTIKLVTKAAVIAKDTVIVSGKTYYPGDTITPAKISKRWVDLNFHMTIFNKLRENPTFNQYYLTRYTDLMQTVFSPSNMLGYLDEMYNTIKPEMPAHIKRWGGTMTAWEKNFAKLRNYISRRTVYLNQGMKDCYQLTGPYDVTFDIAGTPNASLEINSLTIEQFPYVGKYFGNIDTKITASTKSSNLVFDAWQSAQNNSILETQKAATKVKFASGDKVTANFVKAIIATTEIDDATEETSVKAFPTVFNTHLKLQYHLSDAAEVSVSLKDLNGRTIFQANGFNPLHQGGDYQMDLELSNFDLPDNMYFIDFQANKFQKTIKVIKSK